MDDKLRTPLCWAAACGYQPLVELLLENGASLHSSGSHRSPISWAAWNGHPSVVQFLMSCGASIEPDEHCISPLCYAAMKGHYDLVQLFVKKRLSAGNTKTSISTGVHCPGLLLPGLRRSLSSFLIPTLKNGQTFPSDLQHHVGPHIGDIRGSFTCY